MESADLNRPKPGDDALEALLRRPLAAHLPDAGFTARVLAALPPPARRSSSWGKILLCVGGAAAGAAAAFATGHPLRITVPTDGQILAAAQAAAAGLAVPANALTLLIVVAGGLYAWRGDAWRLSR